ncbi:hypothetical protein [Aurantiacibacter poecillastricola]|uniref:hypothetical protein n=1 Tax=Aurantiacibacter poecillastricola TaxID=3064385 RepID=UPI00273F1311|nr:hypothetical protein [Aurantiacibacter sp. 219JJ12-13]MDP5261195.1 hypothetical protein [Aurantiacibacter sp. 219JJ12-13]
MKQFNLGQAWSRAMTLARGNFQFLAVIAGLFLFLPSLLFYVVMPDTMGMMMTPADDPKAMAELFADQAGPIVGAAILLMLCSMVGYAAMVRLMGPGRPTVGEALSAAIRALPTLIGCILLFLVGYLLFSLVFGLLVTALAMAVGPEGAAALMLVLILVLIGYIFARLCIMMPVIVNEGVSNPITAYTRSWKLTKPAAWRIFGFFALLIVAYMVISLLVFGALGLIAAMVGGMFVLALVSSLIGMLVSVVLSGILVAIHEQLACQSGPALGETFE